MEISLPEIVGSVLTTAVVIGGIYYKSYITEKGKSHAVGQDIKRLTQVVEDVRAEVSILTNSKISINQEKRGSFLRFYEKYFQWVQAATGTSLGNLAHHKEDKIQTQYDKLDDLLSDVSNARAIMILWNEDEEFVTFINNMINFTAWGIHAICQANLSLLKVDNSAVERASALGGRVLTEAIEKRSANIRQYNKELFDSYESLQPQTKEFILRSRRHLTQSF
jgi:hypothetical protein